MFDKLLGRAYRSAAKTHERALDHAYQLELEEETKRAMRATDSDYVEYTKWWCRPLMWIAGLLDMVIMLVIWAAMAGAIIGSVILVEKTGLGLTTMIFLGLVIALSPVLIGMVKELRK